MLKFVEITENTTKSEAEVLFPENGLALEIVNSLDFSDPDVFYGIAEFADCMLVRIFDCGRYMFLYPIELSEKSDASEALLAMSEYARREEIGFTLTDVPTDEVARILSLGFRHLDVDCEGENSYRVRIKTECELASRVPSFELGGLLASELGEDCLSEYAELCRDEELGRFWGYDYREDNPFASDEFFLKEARRGFARGVALTLALEKDGAFVGAVELFAFDGRGECECAVKIARKYQGRGFGSLAIEAAIEAARRLGLVRLSCDVMNENTPSLKMVRKYFEEAASTHPDISHFTKEL